MRLTIYRAIEEDPFYSVHVYANNLVRVLTGRVDLTDVVFSRKQHGIMFADRVDGPLNRYVLYPRYAISRQGDVNHVLDHAYGHFGFVLRASRTVMSCNSMSIPKVMTGEIPSFPVPGSLAMTMRVRHAGMLRCARIVACSHALKADIVRMLGCDAARVSVVYDGLDHALFRPIDDEDALNECIRTYQLPEDDTKVLLVVATKAAYKNRLATLKVLDALIRRGLKVVALMVGGPLNEDELAYIDTNRIAPYVKYLGHVPERHLPVIYNLADAFLFPSWDEGFGYPPLEAMACGTPTVVSSIPVLMETTSGAALSAGPDDIAGLTDQVQLAMCDSTVRVRLQREGLARAQTYSWERYAQEIMEVYDSL